MGDQTEKHLTGSGATPQRSRTDGLTLYFRKGYLAAGFESDGDNLRRYQVGQAMQLLLETAESTHGLVAGYDPSEKPGRHCGLPKHDRTPSGRRQAMARLKLRQLYQPMPESLRAPLMALLTGGGKLRQGEIDRVRTALDQCQQIMNAPYFGRAVKRGPEQPVIPHLRRNG